MKILRNTLSILSLVLFFACNQENNKNIINTKHLAKFKISYDKSKVDKYNDKQGSWWNIMSWYRRLSDAKNINFNNNKENIKRYLKANSLLYEQKLHKKAKKTVNNKNDVNNNLKKNKKKHEIKNDKFINLNKFKEILRKNNFDEEGFVKLCLYSEQGQNNLYEINEKEIQNESIDDDINDVSDIFNKKGALPLSHVLNIIFNFMPISMKIDCPQSFKSLLERVNLYGFQGQYSIGADKKIKNYEHQKTYSYQGRFMDRFSYLDLDKKYIKLEVLNEWLKYIEEKVNLSKKNSLNTWGEQQKYIEYLIKKEELARIEEEKERKKLIELKNEKEAIGPINKIINRIEKRLNNLLSLEQAINGLNLKALQSCPKRYYKRKINGLYEPEDQIYSIDKFVPLSVDDLCKPEMAGIMIKNANELIKGAIKFLEIKKIIDNKQYKKALSFYQKFKFEFTNRHGAPQVQYDVDTLIKLLGKIMGRVYSDLHLLEKLIENITKHIELFKKLESNKNSILKNIDNVSNNLKTNKLNEKLNEFKNDLNEFKNDNDYGLLREQFEKKLSINNYDININQVINNYQKLIINGLKDDDDY